MSSSDFEMIPVTPLASVPAPAGAKKTGPAAKTQGVKQATPASKPTGKQATPAGAKKTGPAAKTQGVKQAAPASKPTGMQAAPIASVAVNPSFSLKTRFAPLITRMQAVLKSAALKMYDVRENLLCRIRESCIAALKDALEAFNNSVSADGEELKGKLKISIAPLLKDVVVLKDLDQGFALEVATFILLGGMHHKAKATKAISDMMTYFDTDVGIWSVKPGNFFKAAAPTSFGDFNLKVGNSASLEDDCVCFSYTTSIGYVRAYKGIFDPVEYASLNGAAHQFNAGIAASAIIVTEEVRRADLKRAEDELKAAKATCKSIEQLCAAYAAYSRACNVNHDRHFDETSEINAAAQSVEVRSHATLATLVCTCKVLRATCLTAPVPCRFFGQPGGCRNGTNCQFAHISPTASVPCHFFGQPGGCRNGANCQFAHIAPAQNRS